MGDVVRILLLLVLAGGMSACGGEPDSGSAPPAAAASAYVEKGDLPALGRRGTLRILVHRDVESYLPRAGDPFDLERQLAERFARERGLEPVLVPVADYSRLIPELLAGRGDLVAANMTVTAARSEQVAFSVGVDRTREWIVGRAEGPAASGVDGLRGRSVGVMRDTAFWEVAEAQLAGDDAIEIVALPATLSSDEVLDGLVAADYDFALQDSNVLDVVERYRDDVRRQFPLGEPRRLAWAVRPDNLQLRAALDRFLTRERLTRDAIAPHTDDLDGIRDRGVLRVLTRNNAATYYLYRGKLVGFEYELAKRFAERLGVRLQMVVADDHSRLIPMLEAGRGDMIAAFMTRTDAREAQGVAFSRPYHHAVETIVGPADEPPFGDVSELAGRTLHMRETSSYWETAAGLRAEGVDVTLLPVPADMETEQIIDRVARRKFDLTVADSHILQAETTVRDDVHGLLELGEAVAHGWVVRADNPELLAAVNGFWDAEYRGLHYNIFYRRYFLDDSRMRAHRAGRVEPSGDGRLSPWDELTREFAETYGFDWRLVLAQMYQESRFDPDAVSWVGARGLMQVMPRTARELGLEPVTDPAIGIHAGVRYMDWLRLRFPEFLPVDERMWFALASYNAGVGHVRDARRLAERKGWDPDRWFGHVEEAMLLLAEPRYHRDARHGFVRGREPYDYVRHIRDRYRVYARLVED